MNVEFTLKNYRCFSDTSPARFCVRDGYIAFVGVNNAGKSSLLKFFYEFRVLFDELTKPHTFEPALTKSANPISYGRAVKDWNEIFYNQNSRDLAIEIRFPDIVESSGKEESVTPHKWIINFQRNNQRWSLNLLYLIQRAKK